MSMTENAVSVFDEDTGKFKRLWVPTGNRANRMTRRLLSIRDSLEDEPQQRGQDALKNFSTPTGVIVSNDAWCMCATG